MYKIILRTSALLGTFVAISSAAHESSNKNFYLQGNLGYAMGGYPGKDFEQNSLRTAGVYGAAIGYKFNEHFRADFGIDYRNEYKNKWTHPEEGIDDTQETKVNSWASMISVYCDIAEINKVTPYVMLGAGVARNKADSKGVQQKPGVEDLNYSYSKNDHINFAWKIGAGAKYAVNNSFDLDLHYQFVDLGKFKTGNVMSHVHRTVVITEATRALEGKLKSHEILFGAVYKF